MESVATVIIGAGGRMGQRLLDIGSKDSRIRIAAALEQAGFPKLGLDAGLAAGIGELGVPFTSELPADGVFQAAIDFSQPQGANQTIDLCVARKIPLVMATTGLTDAHRARIADAAKSIPVVFAPSMSPAVNLAMKLTQVAANALKDMDADVEIIERHHRFKVDSPSGTALKFGQIVAEQMGQTGARHGREGVVGQRPHSEIGYHAVRTGDNPGEHMIIFGMMGETLEITVRASNRDCYAKGAFAAAVWLQDKPAGLYSMEDVLGL